MMKYRGLILFVGVVAALLLAACHKDTEPLRNEVFQKIKSVDRLELASMTVTKTARLENSNVWGKRVALYSYDSYLRAYVDLSGFSADDVTVDEKNRIINVTLPPIEIEVAGRDGEMRKEYENVGLLRGSLDSQQRAAVKEKANASFRREVAQNPEFRNQLTDAARRKLQQWLSSLPAPAGYSVSISN